MVLHRPDENSVNTKITGTACVPHLSLFWVKPFLPVIKSLVFKSQGQEPLNRVVCSCSNITKMAKSELQTLCNRQTFSKPSAIIGISYWESSLQFLSGCSFSVLHAEPTDWGCSLFWLCDFWMLSQWMNCDNMQVWIILYGGLVWCAGHKCVILLLNVGVVLCDSNPYFLVELLLSLRDK